MRGELTNGHVVKTGDGVLCRVEYVHADGDVELVPLDGDVHKDRLVLPRGELQRVPDPRNKRPPIVGMPAKAERPRCAWCNRMLRPVVGCEWNHSKAIGASLAVGARVTRRWFIRFDAYEDVFCTTRCAIAFAGASYRGGFRRQRRAS